MSRILLASNSPRRKEILENLGLQFHVVSSEIDEILKKNVHPYKLASNLALQKAENVASNNYTDGLIIAADTIVIHDNVLGKPQNQQDAYEMLKKLSDDAHEVVTGVAIIDCKRNKKITDYEVTKVYFREISDEEIYKYIATGEPMDKAGAYGIQGKASLFIKKIDGDYFNVVGLPIYKLGKLMQEHFNYNLL